MYFGRVYFFCQGFNNSVIVKPYYSKISRVKAFIKIHQLSTYKYRYRGQYYTWKLNVQLISLDLPSTVTALANALFADVAQINSR